MKTGVAYFETRNPRHVRYDLKDMVAHNCNFVVHTMSEYDLNFNTLVMKELVDISHEEGLEVYINPWGLGRVFGGPEPYSHFVSCNPQECQRLSDGIHAPVACLLSKPFMELMKRWIDAVAVTGADIIFWDEPHFHYEIETLLASEEVSPKEKWACSCKRCKSLFKKKYGRKMPETMDDDVISFRDDVVADFFEEIARYAEDKGLKNAVCVLPKEDPLYGVSSWELLVKIPSISIFGTDPYWMLYNEPVEEFVSNSSRRVMDICKKHGKEAQMWVQAFLIWEGREEEVGRAIEVMAEKGCQNIAAWAYLGSAFWNHKCQNHERVWEVIGEAFGKVRGG